MSRCCSVGLRCCSDCFWADSIPSMLPPPISSQRHSHFGQEMLFVKVKLLLLKRHLRIKGINLSLLVICDLRETDAVLRLSSYTLGRVSSESERLRTSTQSLFHVWWQENGRRPLLHRNVYRLFHGHANTAKHRLRTTQTRETDMSRLMTQ